MMVRRKISSSNDGGFGVVTASSRTNHHHAAKGKKDIYSENIGPIMVAVFMIGFMGSISIGYYIITTMNNPATPTTATTTISVETGTSTTGTNSISTTNIINQTSRKTESEISKAIKTSKTITVQSVREEYERRYGGKQIANEMYQHGIQMFGSVEATARRILAKAAEAQAAAAAAAAASSSSQNEGTEVAFVLSFAGYSVTVGRGNHFNQSFPFVIERILKPLIHNEFDGTLNVIVRNSAIGGIPSFPYGFCFEHFLGFDSDVISWDYSMNENGKDASVLEAYIRQSQNQLYVTKPMIIIIDTNQQRCNLVQEYATNGYIQDALCVGMAKDAMKGSTINFTQLLELPNDERPIGFQNWEEFGASSNCPGRGSWHPKKMEHELIGWMISMYFVQAVEIALSLQKQDPQWQTTYLRSSAKPIMGDSSIDNANVQFPPHIVQPLSDNAKSVTDLLYGHPTTASSISSFGNESWVMHKVSCRTNFLPATDHDKVLPSVIVSGLSPGGNAENIINTRSDDTYNAGWVLDVSDIERDTKIKVEKCGGLGYIDMKIALYGIPESGLLRLWLPYEENNNRQQSERAKHNNDDNSNNNTATMFFENLIVCEANEKRSKDACQLDTDIQYTVGGIQIPKDQIKIISGTGEYLKRKTCVHIGIPDHAKVTKLKDVVVTGSGTTTTTTTSGAEYEAIKRRLAGGGDGDSTKNGSIRVKPFEDDHIGIVVDIQVQSERPITRSKGACCLSHIVWEQA